MEFQQLDWKFYIHQEYKWCRLKGNPDCLILVSIILLPQQDVSLNTRMHSSGIHTAHLLTVSHHALDRGCVFQHALGRRCVCIPACTGQGMSAQGVSTLGCLSGGVYPGGCLSKGVSAEGGVCPEGGVCLRDGVCRGGCLLRGCGRHPL